MLARCDVDPAAYSLFQYISTPIQDNARKGGGRGAMILLKHKVLKSLVLRRTKKGRAADLALPPRIVCFTY